MGKFDFNFDADLTRQILALSNVDEIAPKILDEVAPILEKNIKKECRKHKRTGEMENSVKKTKAKKNKQGFCVVVRPTGNSKLYKTEKEGTKRRKVPVRNMEIMAHMEYGTKNQSPTPIMTKGMRDSEAEVKQVMQDAFNRLVGGNS